MNSLLEIIWHCLQTLGGTMLLSLIVSGIIHSFMKPTHLIINCFWKDTWVDTYYMQRDWLRHVCCWIDFIFLRFPYCFIKGFLVSIWELDFSHFRLSINHAHSTLVRDWYGVSTKITMEIIKD